jgi:hypothetical protein
MAHETFGAKTGILDASENDCGDNMLKVAVSEDSFPTSKQLKAWIESACTAIAVRYNHDDVEVGLARERYNFLVLDIECTLIKGSSI